MVSHSRFASVLVWNWTDFCSTQYLSRTLRSLSVLVPLESVLSRLVLRFLQLSLELVCLLFFRLALADALTVRLMSSPLARSKFVLRL
jgi:hypothetical protein